MNNLMRFTVSVFYERSIRVGIFVASCAFACLLSCVTLASWANPKIGWGGADSTSIQLAERDLSDLKEHVPLSKSQQEYLYNMFLGKHQYLEVHDTTGPRWELRVETDKRKLRELLGEEAYLQLDRAGLIARWFNNTQEQ